MSRGLADQASVRRKTGPAEAHRPDARDYALYGLCVRSELALPQIPESRAERIDAKVCVRPAPPDFPLRGSPVRFGFAEHKQSITWPSIATATIEADRINLETAPWAEPALLRHAVIGPAMALLLHMRGRIVLHSSALAIGGQGIALLGEKRAGKSTTAAAFVAAGHRLISDDVLSFEAAADGSPCMIPSIAELRLSDPAIATIPVARNGAAGPIGPGGKRVVRVAEALAMQPVPARRLYVLRRGRRAAVTRLAAAEAMDAFMRFSYVRRMLAALPDSQRARRHLLACADLARLAPVCALDVPEGLDRVGEAVAAVEADLADHP